MEVERRDYARRPLTPDELRELVGPQSPRDLVNPRSPAFRKLGLELADLSEDQAFAIMLQDNALIRRPVIVRGAERIVGFDEAAYARLANS
jgi:arsenate reductase-like glutaredoxin family protein